MSQQNVTNLIPQNREPISHYILRENPDGAINLTASFESESFKSAIFDNEKDSLIGFRLGKLEGGSLLADRIDSNYIDKRFIERHHYQRTQAAGNIWGDTVRSECM